jgi:NAD(P)-dependent dehydrogenase (short-subunit alcohol dehydrogenase family)
MNTQVVLITGGLTGIGRATALAFAAKGAQVVISGRRDEEGQKLVSEIRNMGAEAEFVHADVRREEDVRNLIDKTVERYSRLDVASLDRKRLGAQQPRRRRAEEPRRFR